ncbi:MAG: GAF domain-containing protein [Bacteroidota bacterium]
MAEELLFTKDATRETIYQEILPQIKGVMMGEPDLVANLANVSAILKEAFNFFWVGFYRWDGNELVLGPFQGPLACTRISLKQGVCGAAAREQQTQLVPDVEAFPGHIACNSASKSEVVVPLMHEGVCQLVLDVDSDQLDDFSGLDQQYLEDIVELIRLQHYC